MKYLILTLTFFLFSCSSINEESRLYYKEGQLVRHGIVPIPKGIYLKSTESKGSVVKYDQISAKRGKVIYKDHCLGCHGMLGEGNGPQVSFMQKKPANLVKMVHNVPNFKFYIAASKWKAEMPGWDNVFTEREIEDLTNYIKQLAVK